jgi:prephenate dehydrogenase
LLRLDHLDALAHLDHLDYFSAMSSIDHERIGVIGLGAIGGSLALAWRGAASIRAWSRDEADRDLARAAGVAVCDGEDSAWPSGMADSTAVVVAVPVDQVAPVVQQLVRGLPDECLLLHVASLQSRKALGLSDSEFQRVLGTHPLAGSERSGFGAARIEMFRGATVRAEARATPAERRRIEELWRTVGVARIVWQDATEHDTLMSWLSHLSQLNATALAAVLAKRGMHPRDLGPGGRDATRLAASDLSVWAPILDRAPAETATAVRRLTRLLDELADALETRDARSLERTWEAARVWRMGAEDSA